MWTHRVSGTPVRLHTERISAARVVVVVVVREVAVVGGEANVRCGASGGSKALSEVMKVVVSAACVAVA
jgi:hypothetical protein